MPSDERLTRQQVTRRIARARSLIQEVRDNAEIPVVAHSAHQADVYCHRLMWELGAETANTPELEDPIDPEAPE
jgi:hypothetical protein